MIGTRTGVGLSLSVRGRARCSQKEDLRNAAYIAIFAQIPVDSVKLIVFDDWKIIAGGW